MTKWVVLESPADNPRSCFIRDYRPNREEAVEAAKRRRGDLVIIDSWSPTFYVANLEEIK